MADAKITALTALTAPAAEDLLAVVDDPAGTPVTKKIALSDLIATQAQQEAASDAVRWVTPANQHFHPSAAKFWVMVNGAGTPAIAASYNVTSVADTGTGRMTVTIATDFSSANWAGAGVNASTGSTVTLATMQWVAAKAAGTVELDNADLSATPVVEDPAVGYCFVGFGDL
jgi:hypothetical protein